MPDVIDEAFVEAGLRDEAHDRRWVAIIDGNREQIHCTQAMAANYGLQVTIVVDFLHVLGYLWKAGKALVGAKPAAIEAWVAERSILILNGKCSSVAGGMRRSATRRGLRDTARKAVDDCARYYSTTNTFCATTSTYGTGSPSRRASSRAPAAHWSVTAWTSPEHAGGCPAGKLSSSCGRFERRATSMTTSASTPAASSREITSRSSTRASFSTFERPLDGSHTKGAAPNDTLEHVSLY